MPKGDKTLKIANLAEHRYIKDHHVDWSLYAAVPKLKLTTGQELILDGETAKWVHMSPNRVMNIDIDEDVRLKLSGKQGETVTFSYLVKGAGLGNSYDRFETSCVVKADGQVTMGLTKNTCQ